MYFQESSKRESGILKSSTQKKKKKEKIHEKISFVFEY